MAGLVPAIHVFSNGGRKPAVLLRTRHSLVARMERSDIRETFNPAEIESDSRISLPLNPGYARFSPRACPEGPARPRQLTVTVMPGLYGRIEHSYCDPFAETFDASAEFRNWVLARLGLSDWAGRSMSLKLEQRAARKARFWWKNYYCHESRCACPTLAGREVDILLLCRREDGRTLAIHVECKRPGDTLSDGQAESYPVRAACWASGTGGPRNLLPHDCATTLLICDRMASHSRDDVAQFDSVIYFDEISELISPYPASLQFDD